jgi:hypothetical protein
VNSGESARLGKKDKERPSACPAEKFIEGVETTDPPAGHIRPERGRAYIAAPDGTPSIKRNLSFLPPETTDATEAAFRKLRH